MTPVSVRVVTDSDARVVTDSDARMVAWASAVPMRAHGQRHPAARRPIPAPALSATGAWHGAARKRKIGRQRKRTEGNGWRAEGGEGDRGSGGGGNGRNGKGGGGGGR